MEYTTGLGREVKNRTCIKIKIAIALTPLRPGEYRLYQGSSEII